MRDDFRNSEVGDFVAVPVKIFSANRTLVMPFRSELLRCCRYFVRPLPIGMLGKIAIDFLYLRRKRSVFKGSDIFHSAFFFARCRFDLRNRCSYRFAFDVSVVVLANSFRFASVVTRPGIFYFAIVVDMSVVLFCIIIRYGLPAPAYLPIQTFCFA